MAGTGMALPSRQNKMSIRNVLVLFNISPLVVGSYSFILLMFRGRPGPCQGPVAPGAVNNNYEQILTAPVCSPVWPSGLITTRSQYPVSAVEGTLIEQNILSGTTNPPVHRIDGDPDLCNSACAPGAKLLP